MSKTTGLLDSFIFAENLCTGSQGDLLSNCILENLRFLPFLEDKVESTVKDQGLIRVRQLPYLSGTVYAELSPIGIANARARMMMENDYGVVSFRCLQAFNRPMLSLPRLLDIGLTPREVNITETLTVEQDNLDLGGVPLRDLALCLGDSWCIVLAYIYNSRNLLASFSTQFATIISKLNGIASIINESGNYYLLPGLASDIATAFSTISTAKSTALTTLDNAINHTTGMSSAWDRDFALNLFNNAYAIVNGSIDLTALNISITTNVVDPLVNNITSSTDFTTFNFNITNDVANFVEGLDYSADQNEIYVAQQLLSTWGTPPSYDHLDTDSVQYLMRSVIVTYIYEIINVATSILSQIQALYTMSNVSQITSTIYKLNDELSLLSSQSSYYYTPINGQLIDLIEGDITSYGSKYQTALTNLNSLLTVFTLGTVIADVEAAVIAEDQEAAETAVDTYFDSYGTNLRIQINNMKTQIEDALNLYTSTSSPTVTNPNVSPVSYSASGSVMTLNLGYDYKDKSKYYFADIALAVGFGRLINIESIQIDDEIYLAQDLRDEAGNPITGISESGCTKYTFVRHVLPTYSPIIEMYIYPGLPNQPYCPTVNKYNNYAVTKYSGMFSKMLPVSEQNPEGSMMGLYVYTGYRPMEATVENIYQLGTLDINAINLNDPTVDENSYEAMLQRHVTSLTNSSSLVKDGVITTEDLLFYFKADLVGTPSVTPDAYHYLDIPQAQTLPNLAMIEFLNFPLGTSLKIPTITIKCTAADPYPKA